MRSLFFIIVLVTLTGCGSVRRMWSGVTGYSEVCVEGVVYLQFPSGVTVKYDAFLGKPQLCTK